MSEYIIANKSDLVSIADNLRAKTGSTATMSLSEMSNNIANISTSLTQESVQPDWNQNDSTAADYIKNRPGGYVKSVVISWDGSTDGLYTTSINSVNIYKVSDLVPEQDDLIGGVVKVSGSEDEITITADMFETNLGMTMISLGSNAFIIIIPEIISALGNSETGIFLTKMTTYVTKISYDIAIKFDKCFVPIPEGVVKYYYFDSDTVSVLDMKNAVAELSEGKAIINWCGDNITNAYIDESTNDLYTIENSEMHRKKYDYNSYGYNKVSFNIKPYDGLYTSKLHFYALIGDDSYHESLLATMYYDYLEIGEAIRVYNDGLAIKSSSDNSSKWFKLIIDDNGTFTTTEITETETAE